MPLLQALKPEQLSTTLNALSGALRGRGEAIGANAERTGGLPAPDQPRAARASRTTSAGLAALAEDYDAAADDFLGRPRQLLRAEPQPRRPARGSSRPSWPPPSGSTGELDCFLRENEQRFVRLAADSLPSLQVYARYSPEFPCLAAGLVEAESEVIGDLRRPAAGPAHHPRADPGPRRRTCRATSRGTATTAARPAAACRRTRRRSPSRSTGTAQDGYRDGQPVDPKTGVFGSPSPSPGPRSGAGVRPGPVPVRRRAGHQGRRRRGHRHADRTRSPTSRRCCSARWPAGRPSAWTDAAGRGSDRGDLLGRPGRGEHPGAVLGRRHGDPHALAARSSARARRRPRTRRPAGRCRRRRAARRSCPAPAGRRARARAAPAAAARARRRPGRPARPARRPAARLASGRDLRRQRHRERHLHPAQRRARPRARRSGRSRRAGRPGRRPWRRCAGRRGSGGRRAAGCPSTASGSVTNSA